MKTFKNKVAVITGAGNGIGRNLALLLAQKGAKLALNSKTQKNLEETVSMIKLNEQHLFTKVFDISNKKAVFKFAEEVNNYFGHVDILINNAGVAIAGLTFEELEVEDFEWIFSINYMGTIYTTKAFLPLLKIQNDNTALVNISSVFGLIPMALKTPYCSTKHAIKGFTDSLRMELQNSNINVTGVYPGGVKTGITLNSLKADKEPKYTTEYNKKLKMPPERAAQLILNGILKGKKSLIIGSDARIGNFLNRYFPFIIRNMARKTMRIFKNQ